MNTENSLIFTRGIINACVTEGVNILLCVSNIDFLLYYDVGLDDQRFVYSFCELDWASVETCNPCITAIQLFYMQTCPRFLPMSKLVYDVFNHQNA